VDKVSEEGTDDGTADGYILGMYVGAGLGKDVGDVLVMLPRTTSLKSSERLSVSVKESPEPSVGPIKVSRRLISELMFLSFTVRSR